LEKRDSSGEKVYAGAVCLDIAPQGELSAYFDFHNTRGEEAHYLIYNPD
jgi:hypothetical protein